MRAYFISNPGAVPYDPDRVVAVLTSDVLGQHLPPRVALRDIPVGETGSAKLRVELVEDLEVSDLGPGWPPGAGTAVYIIREQALTVSGWIDPTYAWVCGACWSSGGWTTRSQPPFRYAATRRAAKRHIETERYDTRAEWMRRRHATA